MDSNKSKISITDEELSRMAIEQILQETKRAAIIADVEGPSGWQLRKKSVNKRFLNNSLLANNQFNNRKKASDPG